MSIATLHADWHDVDIANNFVKVAAWPLGR